MYIFFVINCFDYHVLIVSIPHSFLRGIEYKYLTRQLNRFTYYIRGVSGFRTIGGQEFKFSLVFLIDFLINPFS